MSAKATLPLNPDDPETVILFVLILLVPTPTPPEVATVTIPLFESVVTVMFAPAEISVVIPVSPLPDPTNSAAVTLPPTVILVPLNPIMFVPD